MAIKIKHIVVGGLVVATGVGFYIATTKTNGGKGSDPEPAPGEPGSDYRVQMLPHRNGGFYGLVFVSGQPQDDIIGPMPTTDELEKEIARYFAGLDVGIFYTVRRDDAGGYHFDGWTPGGKTKTDGPFASEALAIAAGSSWATKASAVPMPDLPNDEIE